MVFSAPVFLFAFLPVALALYFVSPQRWRNGVLLALSCLFYLTGGGAFIILMLGSAALDFAIARAVYSRRHANVEADVRWLMGLSVGVNVSLLFLFKYAGFATQILNRALDVVHVSPLTVPHLVLPLAISFFTFQRMSFTFDVARGRIKEFPTFGQYLLFGMLFPHLIAGPIVRYVDIEDELRSRVTDVNGFAEGAVRFTHGLVKKVIVSDTIAPVADVAFGPHGPGSTWVAWLGALAYTFQLYFDFSGYSDMAVGLGRMFGFQFLENFNYPYASRSVTEFWRRWHISLSTWFRDYLYVPLGGNRCGRAKTYRNLMIVFLLCGLWHGAEWTFVAWGVYHGVFLIVERIGLLRLVERLPPPLRHLYALAVVIFGWALFRAETVGQAWSF